MIRELLAAAGDDPGAGMSKAKGETASAGLTTPESYLGSARARNFSNGTIIDGVRNFGSLKQPGQDELSYGGKWRVSPEFATSDGGQLGLKFGAKKVYLVLGSPGQSRKVSVELDGVPIDPAVAGKDVKGGAVTVTGERLYELVSLPRAGDHRLTLTPEKGVEGYAFTFG
ncbi:MAG: hypothetical protein IPK93_01980 [Solirubrobacterales bacterium]|nr:hypothetical protein [Solirubrobacterales bacterium]